MDNVILTHADRVAETKRKNAETLRSVNEMIKNLELEPTGHDLVIQPMNNAYMEEKTESGIIIPDIIKSEDSGEFERREMAVKFGLVHKVTASVTRAKVGDLIYYYDSAAAPIPFATEGFSILNESGVVIVVSEDEERSDIKLTPTGSDIVIKPAENPYVINISESGIIMLNETKEKKEFSRKDEIGVRYAIVRSVSKEVDTISAGDEVYYYESSALPIPFMNKGLFAVHSSNLMCVIKRKD